MPILHQLNTIFHDKIPLFILINFIMLIILIYFNRDYIKKFLLKINKRTWYILVLIFFIALMIRIFIPPHAHIIYMDEQLYMEAGKNMLQTGSQGESFLESIGWPFILSIAFGIFGISNWVALYASTLLGALTIFNIFFLTFIITQRKNLSLMSALLFSLFPAHIVWSGSAKPNVASLFFITLTIFFCFLYYKNKRNSLLWLALISFAFASQFRRENYIFLLLFLFGCFIYHKKFFKNINFKFILPWLVLIVLSSANFIQVLDKQLSINFVELETSGKQTGANWSFNNLIYNSLNYGIYIFNSEFQPLLFTFLFVIGAIYMLFKQRKEALFLTAWFSLLWLIYFFSQFQITGGTPILGKTRYFMTFYPITIIFAIYGILLIKNLISSKIKNSKIKKTILILIMIILMISFIPHTIKASTWFDFKELIIAQGLETKIPELAEKDIPSDCIIVAVMPIVLESTTNLKVIEIDYFLEQKSLQKEIFNKTNCILFFEDVYCLYFCCSDRTDEDREQCQNIKENYDLEPYKSYTEAHMKYTFYKIYPK